METTRAGRGWGLVILAALLAAAAAFGYQHYSEVQDEREVDELVCEFDPTSC